MPNKLYINTLDRITLVRKGRATAKHSDLRDGVVEVVKASALADGMTADEKMMDAVIVALNAASDEDRRRLLLTICRALDIPTATVDVDTGRAIQAPTVLKAQPASFDAAYAALMRSRTVEKASGPTSRWHTGRWG